MKGAGIEFDDNAIVLTFMKKSLLIALTLSSAQLFAQEKTDTTKRLKEVVIKPYFTEQPLMRTTGSIGLIDQATFDRQPSNSLVSAVNTISGVRMEERSPGSYRLSIRGSLLRSPFGVRNVKTYFDDFPLTDAGGNTYLNALDIAAAGQIQILKGPQGSIYGANSGGVILIQPQYPTGSTQVGLRLEGGSYGAFHQNATVSKQFKNYGISLTQAYQRSDGYREHSDMDRKYFQLLQKLDYAPNASLKALVFYSDLQYNTPGGLTAAQFQENPKASRLATAFTKSAREQNAGIYSKTLYGGISNSWDISSHFKHVISLYATHTDFKNPFITNYEKRDENTLGLRTYLEYNTTLQSSNVKFNVGVESARTGTGFENYDNNFGVLGAVQSIDDLTAKTSFAFAQLGFDVNKKLLVELSVSANLNKYDYETLQPIAIEKRDRKFDNQVLPRFALSYLVNPDLTLRGSISKGYSAPTTSEVRPSNNVINLTLEPEYGWNYETGFRLQVLDRKLFLDATGFYYNLKSAIVRRVDENMAEFFVNAGGTKQWGLETSLSYWLMPYKTSGLVRAVQIRNAYTLSRFKFVDYVVTNSDFSGNALTGVPKAVVVSSADLTLPKGFYLFLQHNYTSSIPLNDANTAYARKYHLLQGKVGIKQLMIGKVPVEIYGGADNILNQKYSLGNDLNAVGNRYFNAAATRSFYGGLAVKI
jgi:iron complex outermembrane receptor protein